MKASLALAIAILVIGIIPGLFQKKRLAQLREEHTTLAAAAVQSGLTVPDSSSPSRQTKKLRADTGKEATIIADGIVTFYVEMADLQASGESQEQALQDRRQEMKSRLMALDTGRLKQVIASLEGRPGIPDEAKRDIIGFTILHLTDEHPQEALALFTQAYGTLEKSAIGGQVLSSALNRWAQDSPEAALEWIRNQTPIYADVASDQAKRAVVSGTAVQNPALAFQLLGELQPDDKAAAVQAIVTSGQQEPGKSDLVLAALRQHLTTVSDAQERDTLRAKAFESFARHLSDGGFDAGSAWVEKAGFSAQEKEQFSAGLSYFGTKQETGRWIDWLSTHLTTGSIAAPVSSLVSEWTQMDHQSAGKWLVSAQDGPAKIYAVQAYSIAVAEYEPAVAAQWAMTLPAGPSRDTTLRAIHKNWPASDPAGAELFANEHGLK